MQTFRTLNLPTTLETSQHDFVRDFFTPLLARATTYDRGVGYFSSGWGGSMPLVCSPLPPTTGMPA